MPKHTITVTDQHQLIDLNEDLVNFELTFTAKSVNSQLFEALVVDQNTLDNEPNLEFHKSKNGLLSGKIVFDHNKYQNFFLVLRAPQKCEVELIIDKHPIPPREAPEPPPEKVNTAVENVAPPTRNIKLPDKFNWKLILTIIIVLVVLGLIWFYFNSTKTEEEPSTVSLLGPTNISVSSKDSIPPFKPQANTLMSKLNNLVVK